MSSVAKELRDLAKQIENTTLQSPCLSVALPIIRPCVDHLNLLARLHELNAAPPSRDLSGYRD